MLLVHPSQTQVIIEVMQPCIKLLVMHVEDILSVNRMLLWSAIRMVHPKIPELHA